MKIRIIGGNPAGLSAASAVKKAHPEWEVIVYERSEFVSYASCGIPYYVEELVDDIHRLITITKERFMSERDIPIQTQHEVRKVDFSKKELTIKNLVNNQEFQDSFDKLLIATGAKPLLTSGLSLSHPRVFYVRSMENAIAIRQFLQGTKVDKVVIIGAGYIGLEMLEAYLHYHVKEIHLIAKHDILPGKFGEKVRDLIISKGIHLHHNQIATQLTRINDQQLEVVLQDGNKIVADMVQISIGVVPDTDLFTNTPLRMERGAIVVDRFQQTNIPDVFAAGDCCLAYHQLLNKYIYLPLAPCANKQGRVAGNKMADLPTNEFQGVVGTAIFKVLDLHLAKTGISDQEAKTMGYDVDSVMIDNNEIAHYYPGAQKMSILLRFDKKSHLLLGAEILAPNPIGAKKIDVLATALTAKMKIEEIQTLDLAYAPPFGTVWDPIVIAADVASKKLK